mmetsp:Transcript_10513/g.10149  ORF Transcript_10513/g.10149 Transcript_10513/m.10149 type:complete len:149 (+) Transcript_10513:74-520(+)|eukprot:CAMPEP_0119038644 /NCGR_PEP_ID=MMETSP1177-20130426/7690_1 /TAXON_ID=2985 /ORGANISM="Ochromonas sp, Strain CCMP1899" /LENGTH=148 /DNA_ID=CAMNT_0007001499 /DNA_START=46 /DNA_END=492 /DNA_ORIENTATION=-
MMFRFFVVAVIAVCVSAFSPTTPRMMKQSQMQMNMGNKITVAVIAGVMALAPAATFAADMENGAQVFAGNCAACHAGGNNVIQNEKTLRKEALTEYLAGGLKETSIVMQVTNGKNAMPAFGGRLDDDEISDVAAYVYDQSTGEKWDSN